MKNNPSIGKNNITGLWTLYLIIMSLSVFFSYSIQASIENKTDTNIPEINVIKLKTEQSPVKYYYGTVKSLGNIRPSFSSRKQFHGIVESTSPVGTNVMSRITDKDRNIVDTGCEVAAIEKNVFEYNLRVKKANLEKAQAVLANAKKKYNRYKKLVKTKTVSQGKFDSILEEYYTSMADYDYALGDMLVAEINLKSCILTSTYSGIIDKIFFVPGNWSHVDYPVLNIKSMSPIGIDVKMSRDLAKRIYKIAPVKIYPENSNKPIGIVSKFDRLKDNGILFVTDNYGIATNTIENKKNYPVIQSYWNLPLYVSRFNTSLKDSNELSVPINSIYKDNNGYYVWRGKGQKVCQPDSVIADQFQIEKVYIIPGNKKTYINGPCVEYVLLEGPGKLQEYDYILGQNIPNKLNNNDTVIYRKYRYLFNPGDKVKVEIPELSKQGYYVPASSVIKETDNEYYVFINDNGIAKKTAVTICGGNNKYYRIEGNALKEGVEILLLNSKPNITIKNGTAVAIGSRFTSCTQIIDKPLNVSAIRLKVSELPETEKNFYATAINLEFSSERFTTWTDLAGQVLSTRAVGANIMGRVTDLNGNIINPDISSVGKIDSKIFDYNLKSAEAEEEAAAIVLKNSEIEYNRYKKLIERDATEEETFEDKQKAYLSAKADYEAAHANKLDALNTLKMCNVTSVYPGVVSEVTTYPGSWVDIDYSIVIAKLLTPIGLDLKLDRTLAQKAYRKYSKEIFPIGSETALGAFNEYERLTDTGLTIIADNYLQHQNNTENNKSEPIIESYWDIPLYVSRFYTPLNENKPLAVPVESLHKDDKGFYVWKGKGQKVCQTDAVISDRFKIEKVYITPGDYMTFINGPCKQYRVLNNSADLEEYDFILGSRIPDKLKDGDTVFYKKYRYNFEIGNTVRVNIPELVKPGFYVPSSCVIKNANDDCLVFINDNGKAKKINVKVVGGNNKYYSIEGKDIKKGVEVLLPPIEKAASLSQNRKINIVSTEYLFDNSDDKVIDVNTLKLSNIELPESEKSFYGTVRSLDTAVIKFTSKEMVCGNISSTLPLNAPVFSKVTDLKGNIVNKYFSRIATIVSAPFEYAVKKIEAQLKAANANIENKKIKYIRYGKLVKTKTVSQEKYDEATKDYYKAIADFYNIKAQLHNAKDTLEKCNVTSVYTGQIDSITAYPGHWSNIDYALLSIRLAEPIGIDIDLNRSLSRLAYRNYPKIVYPIGSEPIGCFNAQDRMSSPKLPDWNFTTRGFEDVIPNTEKLNKTSLTALLDNYAVPVNTVESNKYHVIESYWNNIAYVSKFNSSVENSKKLSVPVNSIYNDTRGDYVWRCAGQKIYQPESAVGDKFQLEKVYIKPGELKTYINGPNREYRVLADSGQLQEYDCILVHAPDGIKNNDTAVYRKYRFLLNPGDRLKVKIPELVKPGFYVPASSAILNGLDDAYVFINNSGKAKIEKVKLTGGNNKYFRIEGKNIKEGTEIIIPDKKKKITNGTKIQVKSYAALFDTKAASPLNVEIIKLKAEKVPETEAAFSGKIVSMDKAKMSFSTWNNNCGLVESSLPVGANVMPRITDLDNKYCNNNGSVLGKVKSNIYRYFVDECKALLDNAKAKLSNAEIEFHRNKTMYKKDAVVKEEYEDAILDYKTAKAEYDIAVENLKDAEERYEQCIVTSVCSGIVDKIITYPGSWSDKGNPILMLDLMSPIGLEIEMDRAVAINALKKYSKKVYPLNSEKIVGVLTEKDRLSNAGLTTLLDNYLVCVNKTDDNAEYPVIESYWNLPYYVSRFNASIQNDNRLAVPVDSISKDSKGYYVWRAKGQKVYQPNSVIADKFQIEKVYIEHGNGRTYINGPSVEYQLLKNAGKLQEYDFILGKEKPENLKDNDTVVYRKYKYLFNPGDKVKVEIPELSKPGYYVPAASVIQNSDSECYVFINKNGKAEKVKVTITGGVNSFYRIEGREIKDNVEVIKLNKKIKNNIFTGTKLKKSPTHEYTGNAKSKAINVSVLKAVENDLPDSEKSFYGEVHSLDIPNIRFTNWTERYGRVDFTLPKGFPVMSKITDNEGKVLNTESSTAALISTKAYGYILAEARAEVSIAKSYFENAEKEYKRYSSLIKTNTVSKKIYDKAVKYYFTAKADYIAAIAAAQIAEENVKVCTVYSPFSGVIDKILAQPGSWSTHSWPILNINLMRPIGINIELNRVLADHICKTGTIKVNIPDSNKTVGTYNEKNRLTEKGIEVAIDNYIVPLNSNIDDKNYPVIEDYWNPVYYAFRFYSPLNRNKPLAVPLKSIHKDNKGHYVWRAKGVKVYDTNSVINDKFKVEKIYIVPGDLKTMLYGACTDFLILKDSGTLEEYDFLLGDKIPKDLKNNSIVIYRKHKYQFNPGDKLKIEIPELFGPGIYVPASSVILKSDNNCYIYVNDNGKAKHINVKVTGGNNNYYRVESDKINKDTKIVLLDNNLRAMIKDETPLNILSSHNSPVLNTNSKSKVSVLKLKESTPENTYFSGKIEPSDISNVKYSTYQHYLGYVNTTYRPGAYRMSAIRNLDNEVVNKEISQIASIDNTVYEYFVKSKEAILMKCKAQLDNAKIEYDRYKKLAEVKAVSQEKFDIATRNHKQAKDAYAAALADRLLALNDYNRCTVYTAYAGVIDHVSMLPGSWTSRDYYVISMKIMTPAAVNIKLQKPLAELVLNNYPVTVYPIGSDKAIGTLETKNRLTETGLTSQIDNYLVSDSNVDNKEKFPVIEGYRGHIFYVYRFISPLQKDSPLSVPLETLFKDKKGYYVWQAVGQRVFQPNTSIKSKFNIRKVRVIPGDLETYINGVCTKYIILKDAADLKEYDVILGKHIPKDLKDGQTVLYRNYKYLFESGDNVKVEIPDLVKPGFYVPISAVIQKGTKDSYVYINDNGKAKQIKVNITGGTNDLFRIEANEIKNGTEVIIPENVELKDGMPVNT